MPIYATPPKPPIAATGPRLLVPRPPSQRIPQVAVVNAPRVHRPISMVLYGPIGTGKTSFASYWGRVGFIRDSQEQGIDFLADRGLVPRPVFIRDLPYEWQSWDKLLKYVYKATAEPIDTLVIESMIGIQNVCFKHHAKKAFSTNEYPLGDMSKEGFYSFQKGPKNAAEFEFPDFMEAVNVVLASGKNVIITGHSRDKQVTSDQGTVYQKNLPVMEIELWTRLSKWASIVAFMYNEIEQDKEKSRRLLKKVAKSDMNRLMQVEATPYSEAKNWWGIKGVISCGDSGLECYNNFMEKINRAA